jgi:predicted DCC family thiol-disulfide oxidoreductase YuxK
MQVGLFAVQVFGLTIGPGLWRLVWQGDARLLAPSLLLRFGALALTVVGVFTLVGVAVRWLTRNRARGLMGASVLMFLLMLPLIKYNRFPAWIAAAVPPDLADAELQLPALYVSLLLVVAYVVVGVRGKSHFSAAVREAEIDSVWRTVPLHPGFTPGYNVLVYDGDCAFCSKAVQFILAREDRETLLLAPRQSAFGNALAARHPELRDVSSVIWVSGDDMLGELVFTRWEAIEKMGWYLGGAWQQLTRITGALIPVRILDTGYALIAAVRHRLAPSATCRIPTPDDRRRLLA